MRNCTPSPNSHVESQHPAPRSPASFANRLLRDAVSYSSSLYSRWARIQRDWCPCRKRGLRRRPGDKRRPRRKDGHVMMEQCRGAMRPQLGTGGGRGQPPGPPGMPTLADPLAWDFRSPDCGRRGFCRVRPPACSKPSQQARGAGRLVCLGSLDRGPSSGSVTADTALPGEGPPFGVCTWLERSAESPASVRRTGLRRRRPASGGSPPTGGSHALALSLHLCGV